ncbi:MAG: hypothetical protein JW801_07975 [Bacteroidales bacterium]|nr:hypothetical protein [Bacteroidales bacterium]
MKIKILLTSLILAWATVSFSQNDKQACVINMKSGETLDAIHFGQLKCGAKTMSSNYIIVRGKFMDSPTEIKEYRDIEKIVPEGYEDAPVASIGNEKGVVKITKRNGVVVTLTDAEIVMSCYGTGDLYNQIVVQILNPLTNQPAEKTIETRNIQSIIFK